MKNCKVTLREHIETIEGYYNDLNKNYNRFGMDYPKKTIIGNSLQNRVYRIKEYLSIPYQLPKRKTMQQMFKDIMKDMGTE